MAAAAPVTLQVEHHTGYAYGSPVEWAQHMAFLRPLDDATQRLERFEMTVDPAPAHRHSDVDRFGNRRTFFSVAGAHRELNVQTTSRVRVSPPGWADPQASLPWEAVGERLRYAAGAPFEPATEFAVPSPYVPRLDALLELAAPCFGAGVPIGAAARALMHRLHGAFTYESASTGIDTPLAEVLRTRRGVCQDFAHLMIGCLRQRGLAARYVSGYLLTAPGAGLLGADASHAWVAVWCPRADGTHEWLELDPTNDVLPGTGHVRLAWGRDFGDVTPLRGVIRGGGEHTLAVRVRTAVVG